MRRNNFHRSALRAVLVAASLAICARTLAQTPGIPSDPGVSRQTQTVFLAGQVELARLVDLASDRLKVKVQYDAAVLKGTVTLRLGDGVSDAELWGLTNRAQADRLTPPTAVSKLTSRDEGVRPIHSRTHAS